MKILIDRLFTGNETAFNNQGKSYPFVENPGYKSIPPSTNNVAPFT